MDGNGQGMPDGDTSILILQSSGLREPRRTYAPLYIATTAATMDMDVYVWFMMEGVTQLKRGAAEQVELVPGSGVTLKNWLDRARDAGVKFYACAQAMEAEEMTLDDVVEGCQLRGTASVIDLILEVDQVMYF